ncbi:MAG TPA: phasin family protein [Burkholderiales bacterium]|jgi:phasin family protein|nr:phasin family protein [Burkholderiales bacterium]
MNQPQAEFLDLYRAGLKNAADLMKASLESAERLQNQQLSAIRNALEQQSKAMNELGEARSFDQLISVQQQMAGANFERVMGYWSNLCQVAGQNQMAAITQAQAQMAQARDWLNETCALTARATEEAARLAAATTSTASVRQAAKQAERRTA